MSMVEIRIEKRLFKLGVFIAPVLLLICFALLRWVDMRIYLHLLYEDRPVEYLTAICYLAAVVFAFRTTFLLLRNKNRWHGFVYGLFALGLFLIFGEEISWGQRLFGIESPEYFQKNSSQKEINVHNLYPIQSILHRVYIFVGCLGAFLWIIVKMTSEHGKIFNRVFIPGWYLMFYFLPVALFYTYLDFIHPGSPLFDVVGRDQEPAEFVLCLGFLLFSIENWLAVARQYGVRQSGIVTADLAARHRIPN